MSAISTPLSASAQRHLSVSRRRRGRAAVPVRAQNGSIDAISEAKEKLKFEVNFTNRGGAASTNQQGLIEEAQVGVESLSKTIDFSLLEGNWRLLYTSAPDVLPLVAGLPEGLPSPVTIGDIFQRFSSPEEGRVDNVIKFGVPFLLDGDSGATACVRAKYRVKTSKIIELFFEEARIGSIRVSPLLEGLLAPAILPRGTLQMRLLQELRSAELRFPFRTASSLLGGPEKAEDFGAAVQVQAHRCVVHADARGMPVRTRGGEYLITYLDQDMLIGRTVAVPGSFVFEKVAEDVDN